jgi:hypothetical protein
MKDSLLLLFSFLRRFFLSFILYLSMCSCNAELYDFHRPKDKGWKERKKKRGRREKRTCFLSSSFFVHTHTSSFGYWGKTDQTLYHPELFLSILPTN